MQQTLDMKLRRAGLLLRGSAGAVYDRVSGLAPACRQAAQTAAHARQTAVPYLNRLSRSATAGASHTTFGRVLVDGMWDNPNYYFRYALLRAALGLAGTQEIGLFGRYRRREVAASFDLLGIGKRLSFYDLVHPSRYLAEARELLADVRSADDLTQLALPYEFPALLFYDGLLTRQRRGSGDPNHPLLADHLAEQLACLHAADRLIAENRFDLVVLSHTLNFDFSSIAWSAFRHGCRVAVLYGDFGTARFIKIEDRADFFEYTNRPSGAEMDAVSTDFRARLRQRGGDYLDRRYRGVSGDIGATFAYVRANAHIDRTTICQRFGFDPARPLVTVYASNWFDFPHSCAMEHFRDFQDWIETTARVAAEVKDVNWLFKPHPCDDWYPSAKGPTLAKIIAAVNAPNVQLTDKHWNALDLMRAIDGGITYHGTVGIELAGLGKPVMVADRGFYGDCGFVLKAPSRQDYLDALRRDWWRELDTDAAAKRAKEFVGWYFCPPDWHGHYLLPDDSEQDRIYQTLPQFLADNRDAIIREITLIRDWHNSPSRLFHTYKIRREAAEWDLREASVAAS
jgi:hypothetical protein